MTEDFHSFNDHDVVRAHWDGSFMSCVAFSISDVLWSHLQHAIWIILPLNFPKLLTVLRVMAPFEELRVHDKIWGQKTVMAVAPLQIQFIYSFVHFKSAHSFTLTDRRWARRPLKILIWAGGSLIKFNNYPHIDTYSSYDSVAFATSSQT